MKKLAVARTKEALKSFAKLQNSSEDNYVFLKITDNLRNNKILKSLDKNIQSKDYSYMMVLKDFVVITSEGSLKLNVQKLAENAEAKELNTPDVEKIGDKVVEEGVLKSKALKELESGKLSKESKDYIAKILKGIDAGRSEDVPSGEEFVKELDKKTMDEEDADVKSEQASEKDEQHDEKREKINEEKTKSAPAESEEDKEEEGKEKDKEKAVTTKSIRDIMAEFTKDEVKHLMTVTKSLSTDEPVFRDRQAAKVFATKYNSRNPQKKAVVVPAGVEEKRKYGNRAKVKVVFE